MSTNWFSLAKTKRTQPIIHKSGDSYIQIDGSAVHGLATIYDQDILIYIISNLQERKNNGETLTDFITLSVPDYFYFIGKRYKPSVNAYADFTKALIRLFSTKITTNIESIRTDPRDGLVKDTKAQGFSFLLQYDFSITELLGRSSEYFSRREYKVQIPRFIFNAVKYDNQTLKLNPDYFKLTSATERFLYLYARKSAGIQSSGWTESIENIHRKSGALSSVSKFLHALKPALQRGSILDYKVTATAAPRGTPQLHFQHSKRLAKES